MNAAIVGILATVFTIGYSFGEWQSSVWAGLWMGATVLASFMLVLTVIELKQYARDRADGDDGDEGDDAA